jgi:hypothetical protein
LHAVTDASGAYSITSNPGSYTGDYTLTASLAGFMSTSVTFTIPNGATVVKNLMLTQLGSLSGTVRDTMGRPIANATVTAGTVSGRSDAAGTYKLEGLDPGPTDVIAGAAGFDPTQIHMIIAAGAHDIALTPASATIAQSRRRMMAFRYPAPASSSSARARWTRTARAAILFPACQRAITT